MKLTFILLSHFLLMINETCFSQIERKTKTFGQFEAQQLVGKKINELNQKDADTLLKSKYALKIEKGTFSKENTQTFWIIPTTLTNASRDTLRYYSMSCSWEEFYAVSNDKLQVESQLCDKNIPKILMLPPGGSSTVKIRLLISQTMDASAINFKIGMHIIEAKGSVIDFDHNELKKTKNIIWSNSISM